MTGEDGQAARYLPLFHVSPPSQMSRHMLRIATCVSLSRITPKDEQNVHRQRGYPGSQGAATCCAP
jgi:hypothetical protein